MKKIALLSAPLLAFSLNVNSAPLENLAKADGDFLGIFTTEGIDRCSVLDQAPVRVITSYSLSLKPREVASWVDDKTEGLKQMALNQGMNAIVGFSEELSLSTFGGVATFTGVGVKVECPVEEKEQAPTSESGIPQY